MQSRQVQTRRLVQAELSREGRSLVVVHGGSDGATRLGEQLGHPPRFVTSPSGHTSRLTDERTLEMFVTLPEVGEVKLMTYRYTRG